MLSSRLLIDLIIVCFEKGSMASVNSDATRKVRRGRPASGRVTVRRLLEKKRVLGKENSSILRVPVSESTPPSEPSNLLLPLEKSVSRPSSSSVVTTVTDSASISGEHLLFPDSNDSREFIAGKVSAFNDIINLFENVANNSEVVAYCDLQLMLLEPMLGRNES
jgi:hypothetical protein